MPGSRIAFALACLLLSPSPGIAGDRELVVYHSWDDIVADVVLDAFSRETGIRVQGMRRSSRHLVKLIEAERDHPRASAIMGGSAPSYVMLDRAGLLEAYLPAGAEAIPESFRDPDGCWTGFYIGVVAFGTDSRTNDSAPQSYAELLDRPWRGGVVYANPATSGTAYSFLLGLVATRGEDGAFDYLSALHPRVLEYPSGGAMAVRLVELQEAGVAVSFAHDIVRGQRAGEPLVLSFPAEGAGWEIGACGLLAGAPWPEAARRFLDFLVRPETQERIGRVFPAYPTHPQARVPDGVPPLGALKRAPIDIQTAGQRWDERARRWNRLLPRSR
ncbi:MAG: extracellular solute-binding protein [Deltaproteobacteria bacterium]|nr:extracellular solute-binding protein [Deltaproteobacteria bacterium]